MFSEARTHDVTESGSSTTRTCSGDAGSVHRFGQPDLSSHQTFIFLFDELTSTSKSASTDGGSATPTIGLYAQSDAGSGGWGGADLDGELGSLGTVRISVGGKGCVGGGDCTLSRDAADPETGSPSQSA